MHLYYRMNDGSLRVSGNLLPLLIIELLLAAIYIYVYLEKEGRKLQNYRERERGGERGEEKEREMGGREGGSDVQEVGRLIFISSIKQLKVN